jgi:hypothetical protein
MKKPEPNPANGLQPRAQLASGVQVWSNYNSTRSKVNIKRNNVS